MIVMDMTDPYTRAVYELVDNSFANQDNPCLKPQDKGDLKDDFKPTVIPHEEAQNRI